MKVNKLDYRFIAKYNKLYYEVAKYYGITSHIRQSVASGHKDINFIVIQELGLKGGYSADMASDFLKDKYPHLLPLYKLYHYIHDGTEFDKSIFDKINNSIKTIRNKK